MSYLEVNVPEQLSLTNSIDFCNKLWSLEYASRYDFNFKNLDYVEPFTMAYVSNEIKRFRMSRSDSKFTAKHHETHTYPAHMGFFKSFGLNFGNRPGEASGNINYIPLTIIKISDIEEEARNSFTELGNVIEEKARQISLLLVRKTPGDLLDTLTFSIREIIRNSVEHSDSEIIEYCGQYWPSKSMVEVAILDTGSGIKSSLSRNPHLNIETDIDALYLALLPGISGKMYKGIKRRKNDVWQNSGFGLYMTSRICRLGQDFFIASNSSGLLLNSDGKHQINTNYYGTALRLRINTKQISSYSGMLEKFKNEGYEAAKYLSGNEAIKPSLASIMLARDFQKI